MKKILTTILIIVVIVALGFGAYWFFDEQQRGGGNEAGRFSIGDYFPFGKSSESPETTTGDSENGTGSGAGTGTSETGGEGVPIVPPQLWQISENPQSGAAIFKTGAGTSSVTFVRYLDRATGNVFESKLSQIGRKRISNTTIPKVYEALWFAKGNSLVLRYTSPESDAIKSLFAKIVLKTGAADAPGATNTATGTATGTEPGSDLMLAELQGTFLPGGIAELAIEPGETGNEKIFYLTENQSGGAAGFTANSDGSKPAQIFDSPLHEWLVSWPKKGTIALTTKPSGGIAGYMYFLNSTSGKFEKILGGISALTTLTKPDGLKVLYSISGTSGFSTGLYTIKTAENIALPQVTLPEKCVWSKTKESTIYCAVPRSVPGGKYPDAWYQGLVSFDDAIWKINTVTKVTEILIDPRAAIGKEIDAVNLLLDQDEKYLIFTNKKDYQLWGLRLLENS